MESRTTAPKSAEKHRSHVRQPENNPLHHPSVDSVPVAPSLIKMVTPALRKPQDVLAMQRTIGNTATLRLIQREGGGAGAPAPGPADPVKDALTLLRAGPLVERNTAQMIDTARVTFYYIDQCPPDPDSKLEASSPYLDILHPKTKEKMRIQKNFVGFRHDDDIFGARSATVERLKTLLIHEVNHAMRGDHESDEHADSLARFKDEFQAYWVAEFSGVADLDDRARQIRTHVVNSYVSMKARYDSDAAFKAQVDAHTRPDGNTLNSLRWQVAEQAVDGTNKAQLYVAIRAMNAEERQAIRANTGFMAKLKKNFDGDNLLQAYLLLFDFSEHAFNCVEAMRGAGTDEEKIYSNLLDMSATERARIKAYGSFMDRLRNDLNDDEMGVVNRILNK